MAYNLALEKRIESAFEFFPEEIKKDIELKKMFGGLAYLFRGKMTIGIVKEELCVRVISARMDEVMARAEARPMDFTGKPMKEFIYVSDDGFRTEEQLQYWIELGLEHAKSKLNLK